MLARAVAVAVGGLIALLAMRSARVRVALGAAMLAESQGPGGERE